MSTRRPSAPADLADRGKKFWRDVVKIYDLNLDELQLLTEACRTLDDCEVLRARIELDGVMVRGSTGQTRLHPAVAELRQTRALLGKLLAQLGLPDVDGLPTDVSSTSRRASKAATARWDRAQQARQQRQEAARGKTS